jgi:hypothetical protein
LARRIEETRRHDALEGPETPQELRDQLALIARRYACAARGWLDRLGYDREMRTGLTKSPFLGEKSSASIRIMPWVRWI